MKTLVDILEGETLGGFLAKCSTDFKLFTERVLSGTIPDEILDVRPFHEQWVNMFLKNRRSLVVAPRGSGKTTILSIAFPLWVSLFNKNNHFLIVSNTMHQSTDIMERIRLYIEHNELLLKLKPDINRMTWTKTELNMNNFCKIVCKPFSNNVRGGQYNWVLCDEGGIFEDQKIFYRAVVNTTNAKNGNLMVIGTRNHEADLLGSLMENQEYKSKIYPIMKKNKLLWGDRYPKSRLDKIKNEIGEDSFAREYMCKIHSEEQSPFALSDLVGCRDITLRLTEDYNPAWQYYVGADFALSGSGDWTAFVVVGKRPDNKVQLVNIYRMRGVAPSEQIRALERLNANYHPVKMVLDISGFGRIFFDELIAKGAPVIGAKFTPEERNFYITISSRKVRDRGVVIPYDKNHSYTTTMVDRMTDELNSFVVAKTRTGLATYKSRSKYDDVAIAFMLAIKGSHEIRSGFTKIRSGDIKVTSRKPVVSEPDDMGIVDIITR